MKIQNFPNIAIEQYNRLFRKKENYQRLFLGINRGLKPEAEVVLKDLQKFCRGRITIRRNEVTGTIDPLELAAAAARREVYDRILHFLYGAEKDMRNIQIMTEGEQ